MNRKKIKFFLFLFLMLVLARFLVVPYMGSWLVKDDALQPADAMVMLMGSVSDRVLEVFHVYEAGYAQLLLLPEPGRMNTVLQHEYGIGIPINADIAHDALLELGVPHEHIIVLPWGTSSTKDEAMAVRTYLENHSDIRSVILVTSASHSRRASMIFQREFRKLDHDVQLISRPSRYSSFQARGWYRHRESTKAVIYEYIKTAAWLIGF
jgi:uncharacterized SAM-binding protein YcdF (DUF218 family)